jgi:UDP-N-acetylglucosamine 4,6-dehydratase
MRIAITGGSGSLGRALIRRLAEDGADRIVTFSRDEQKRAALQREFGWHPGFRVFAGDVRDEPRMEDIFHGCEVVVHAAARKVVTAHPDEPEELLKTNVLGTQNVIHAARQAGIRKLLFISSDKAVRAENVYGVSKAMAEHLAIMANARTIAKGLRIGVVRYGNVLGSTGSVLPLWRAQKAAGQLLTLSDRRMTRFWITLPQAVDLVLLALSNLRGGEIVVPHIPAAPIATLLRTVLEDDDGHGPDPITETGIRQGGEKLHEELLSAAEVLRAVRRGATYVVPPFQNADMWDAAPWVGEPVAPDLAYRSDVWPWQLTVPEMRNLLLEAEGALVAA